MLTLDTRGPYVLGYTHDTMINTKALPAKINLSTDNDLKLDHLKLELLVIVGQNTTVNFLSELYKPPITGL